ncbi:MAG: pseudouridine-5'-phosphate glycosidase, partial [Oscillospiraceae bacterium]|nr:pseudouridine-5'-phosphate glycosidase [Oscillospiraceae bacterium]
MLGDYISIKEDIKQALLENRPVVALESTIISHGMPYPQNVETALKVEKIVRDNGATPSTIAIINGKLKIGLTHDEIDFLGKSKDIIKTSIRDIPYILANKLHGATTVAA